MEKSALKAILQNHYEREKWRSILHFIAGNSGRLNLNLEPVELKLTTKKQREIVNQLFQLGTLKTTDGIDLPIFEVELQDQVKIEYNRVGVNELIKAFILKDAHKGALVTFHHATQKPTEWRFSFISKQAGSLFFDEVVSVETNPKKYTYIFGTPEQHRTAIERIYNLKQSSLYLDDFFEAFNVEPVSKNFFKEYKNFYLDFVNDLASSEDNWTIFKVKGVTKEGTELEIRNFVKRLLGRLVFLYFLQKKRWLGASDKNYEDGDTNFLENLFKGEYGRVQKETFYNDWLSKLFFEALNTPDREKDAFALPNNEIRCIPFLNGGLFEETHEPEGHRAIRLEGFRLEELFTFFNSYNFTIYENSPDEHTMAVDPEMLGHIFENLLEDNKDKGAFYTPKEIVHYMTQESLIEYLLGVTQYDRSALEKLVKYHQTGFFTKDELQTIEQHIDAVKICDPAIGSGAFPMGLLQEIFALKLLIHYKTEKLGEPNAAQIKQDIIQNSIYGVDIEEGAVDIARLRFWLSLVVDEKLPKALPNLDYKIVVGNSLVSKYEFHCSIENVFTEFNKRISEGELKNSSIESLFGNSSLNLELYKSIVNDFMNESNPSKKHLFKLLIQEIKNSFKVTLARSEKDDLSKARGKLFNLRQPDIFGKVKGSKKDISKAEKVLKELELEREKTLSSVHFESAIEWRFEFPHLLAETGDFIGFDIVIGNPPYIPIQKMDEKAINPAYRKYTTFSQSSDIYCLFYERAETLLRRDGVIAYITSNSWMKTKYGKSLRTFLKSRLNPLKLLNFEDTLIFPSATVEANIFIGTKDTWRQKFSVATFDKNFSGGSSFSDFFDLKKIDLLDLDEEGWIILSPEAAIIKEMMFENSIELKKWDIDIKIGILNGYNEAFIIPTKIKDEIISKDPKSIEIIKPLLQGKDLKRYKYEWNEKWLINTHNGIKQKNIPRVDAEFDYPAIYEHLLPHSEQLIARNNKGDHWTNLRSCGYFLDFEQPKIIWGELSDLPKFVLDKKGMYAEATLFAMTGKNLKYLLAILNSKPATWFFNLITTTSGMGTSRWKKYKIEQLPIPKIFKENLFNILVDIVMELKNISNNHNSLDQTTTDFFEEVIDGCVFEIYFKEHMQERGINILDLVEETIQKHFGEDFDSEQLIVTEHREKIHQLYLTLKEGEVQKRMRDFVSKSPDILKPIIQQK